MSKVQVSRSVEDCAHLPARIPPMRHLMLLLVCGMPLLTGCTLGPMSLQNSRLNYNRAIQHTSREELLLNLVRMRYYESEEFLGVSSITGQYTYDADLRGTGAWPAGDRSSYGGSLGLGAQSKPTIVYAPEQGSDFNQRKLSPVSLETLDLLASKGWAVDRVLRVVVRNINDVDNATSAGGPTPGQKPDFEEFQYLAGLLRSLQLDQHSVEFAQEQQVTVAGSKLNDAIPLEKMQLDGEDVVLAASNGYQFRLSEDGSAAELWSRDKIAAVPIIMFHETPLNASTVNEIRSILNLAPDSTSYRITLDNEGQLKSPNLRRTSGIVTLEPDGEISPGPQELKATRDRLTVSTRSLKEMMFYLSHAVCVPQEHYNQGLVRATYDESGRAFDWTSLTRGLFRVCVSENKPDDAAVSVERDGYWYFIRSNDLDSKSTFNLLLELINLEIRAGGGAQIPLLTI